jgi:hypothetical protein
MERKDETKPKDILLGIAVVLSGADSHPAEQELSQGRARVWLTLSFAISRCHAPIVISVGHSLLR